ncbi:MAG TPA: phosphoglycerate dehydrogenase [Candidatus Dormibacteraeota bacterium]|jgi:D-3-phosphoglycerate dehydrogenase|nr:phosphoglycerate dehydrogenase [Candidatus Dormibacteraeota bacterium]
MTTATSVIDKFGGQTSLARMIGKGQSTVQYWSQSGIIPAKWQQPLLDLARENGIELKPADFVQSPNGQARILVADPLAEDGLIKLRDIGEVEVKTKLSEADLIDAIADVDALVVRSETKVTAAVLEAGKRLKVVGRAGVGVDNIDIPAATARGILVVNAPRGNIIAAAEHAIALMMSLARNVPQADASIRRGEWTRAKFTGTEIRGKVLGIVGLGNIGSEVAKRAQGLEMETIAFDPVIPQERAEQFNVELVSLHDLMRRADFITVHAPLTDRTRNLIGAPELALVKPNCRLINAARGGIVNEAALFEVLSTGKMAAAAADVFEKEPIGDSPLLTLPNFVATPHIAASTTEAQTSVAADVAEEVISVLAGELPRYAVNAPALPPEEMALLRPFAELTSRLASLYRQLEDARVSQLDLEYEGEIADHDITLLTAAAVNGLLSPFTEERINPVNARLIAANRGLKLTERKTATAGTYPNLVHLKARGTEIAGTVLMGEARVTRIGPFRVDFVPDGRFLVSRHEDRPGVVGHFGTVLGSHDINIASMHLGRDAARGRAMMILAVDEPVGEDLMAELKNVEGMSDLRYVEL